MLLVVAKCIMDTVLIILQLIVALGILNVWLLRASKVTPYRGRDANNLKQEFYAYGLNNFTFYCVGVLKLSAAVALFVGIAFPPARIFGAGVLVILMTGAILMHVKVKDTALKSLPATVMLLMSILILVA